MHGANGVASSVVAARYSASCAGGTGDPLLLLLAPADAALVAALVPAAELPVLLDCWLLVPGEVLEEPGPLEPGNDAPVLDGADADVEDGGNTGADDPDADDDGAADDGGAPDDVDDEDVVASPVVAWVQPPANTTITTPTALDHATRSPHALALEIQTRRHPPTETARASTHVCAREGAPLLPPPAHHTTVPTCRTSKGIDQPRKTAKEGAGIWRRRGPVRPWRYSQGNVAVPRMVP